METKIKNSLPKREEIDAKYKWKLEDIYADNSLWEEDFNKVKQMAKEVETFKGKLAQSAETLLNCLKFCDELKLKTERIFVYARMRRDEDNANPVYQALANRAQALYVEVATAISFITPELTSIPEETLYKFLNENNDLKVYETYIKDIIRQKEHTLSDKEESLLASASEMAASSRDIFTMFNNADIKFPFIKDEKGQDVEVTKGKYIKLLESRDRRVRKDAFDALYSSYKSYKNTLATLLAANLKGNKFYATARKYGSCLEASLDDDNISADVYTNLVKTINDNLHLLHRYVELRKKALKLDDLHMYDLYVPIVEQPEKEISYEQALDMVTEGLSPMGDEYINYLKEAFKSGWIDVYENEGKTSGAYSWGAYGTHPYVLLNYQGIVNDVFTIAHEMGHAMHSFFTDMTQPYIYSEYKIFVAEVASTVNESLLMAHLMKKSTDKKEKAYLLNHYLEEFRGTVFRQVMFAEFEMIIHEKMEKGEALTVDSLCKIYYELNKKYFGTGITVDEDISFEWARIPHFYRSFYVYKYATGFSAATSLSRQILNEGEPAVERYKSFLRSGCSDYPLELLKKAGVDLTTPKPIEDALQVFAETLDELEKIILS
ncbi:MAG TPA: oligoendopeptidase F [Clostridiaceae bacterium]|nr:oligoendopeptidase F [Clostridiaceae bacterium]